MLSASALGFHTTWRLGAGFAPPVLRTDLIDEVISVRDDDAIAVLVFVLLRMQVYYLAFPLFASLYAAIWVAKRTKNANKLIVTIQPSFGERYLSSFLYKDLCSSEGAIASDEIGRLPYF